MKPKDAGEAFQYEGELVAVFGKRARNVSKENASTRVRLDHRQRRERAHLAEGRSYAMARKNADTFKPMGPWIVTGLDPDDMRTAIRVNGR